MKEPSLELLGEKRFLAYILRGKNLSFREIGEIMKIDKQRANWYYRDAIYQMNKEPTPMDGLSIRVQNALNNCWINTPEKAMEAFKSGKLRPCKYPRNYGWKSHAELAKWLGLPEPTKLKHPPKVCLHCGKPTP